MSEDCNGERTLNSKVQRLVDEWMELDKNPVTRKEIQKLASQGEVSRLEQCLGSRMTFGTAGLRAKMAAGYTFMNELTIIQTSQGLCKYLQAAGENGYERRRILIGFDARHNSLRFAQLSTSIFINGGFEVFLFSKPTPTPFVAYGVRKLGCVCGVMITASHNPKEYNGYKVFWSNGAQIIPPHDKGIAEAIEQNLVPWPKSWDTSVVVGGSEEGGSAAVDPLPEVWESYCSDLLLSCYRRQENPSTPLRFTYTPMHGVGAEAMTDAFRMFGLPAFTPVPEQIEPDPEFPTVKFPNPEEGKSALELAMRSADAVGSTVILANDPDADRLAIAEKNPSTGRWRVFSGNEIGSLMGWWAFENYRRAHPDYDGKKVHMFASTVSSKFLRSMAEVEGFQFQETLTGFKWMGNIAHEHMLRGEDVLFAYEEAIGFMFGSSVLDKDGVSAAVVMAEFATWLHAKNATFGSHLEEMYLRYGRFISEVSYFICECKDSIKALFNRLRKDRKYPTTCGGVKVLSVVDLTIGYDSSRPPDYKPVLPIDPNTQLITFTLENGCVFTLRTSGTEPKVKYYVEVCSPPGTPVPEEELRVTLNKMVDAIVEEFLQPQVFGLLPRPS